LSVSVGKERPIYGIALFAGPLSAQHAVAAGVAVGKVGAANVDRILEKMDAAVAEEKVDADGVRAPKAEPASVVGVDLWVLVVDPAIGVAGEALGRLGVSYLEDGVEPRRGRRVGHPARNTWNGRRRIPRG
jgi:hypothetical protein